MSTISNPTLSYMWLPWSEIQAVRSRVNRAPTFQHRAQLSTIALKGTYKMKRIETTKIVMAARTADGGRQKNQIRLTAFGPIADQQQAHSRPFPITPNLPASKLCAALNPDSFHRMEPKVNTAGNAPRHTRQSLTRSDQWPYALRRVIDAPTGIDNIGPRTWLGLCRSMFQLIYCYWTGSTGATGCIDSLSCQYIESGFSSLYPSVLVIEGGEPFWLTIFVIGRWGRDHWWWQAMTERIGDPILSIPLPYLTVYNPYRMVPMLQYHLLWNLDHPSPKRICSAVNRTPLPPTRAERLTCPALPFVFSTAGSCLPLPMVVKRRLPIQTSSLRTPDPIPSIGPDSNRFLQQRWKWYSTRLEYVFATPSTGRFQKLDFHLVVKFRAAHEVIPATPAVFRHGADAEDALSPIFSNKRCITNRNLMLGPIPFHFSARPFAALAFASNCKFGFALFQWTAF
ncbi:uncharacterized protein CLUP02_05530 [Colletotrichum lupini]|uniref:Uncharacterized protein n=1 Tax=Colletotrichum lupini TaxID=145971 RepID=A0A9Q8WDT1_9PEZI|nr:uncharacterized protein CLUP02_05530 [Colletotrichum lupini]UQC80048.1 hypothetical protein CLUP02_05530 [Colletotrichum lupini]